MPRLEVRDIRKVDVYKDIARVPRSHRTGPNGKTIPEARICKVSVGKKSAYLSIRGQQQHHDAAIHLDETTKGKLGVAKGSQAEFQLTQVGWLGQFLWASGATDPAYRIAARIGAVSVGLGAFGVLLGAISVFLSVCALGGAR